MPRRPFATALALMLLVGSLAGCGGQPGSESAQSEPKGGQTAASTGSGSQAASPAKAAGEKVPGVTDNEIVIGTWMPLTGPAAAWGVIGRTYEPYFKMINDQGGIHGRKLRLVMEDDAYNPGKAVAAVKKMVEQDNVFAILGGLGTPSNSAVMDYLISKGVPHLAPSTGSSKWATPFKKTWFAWQLNYTTEGKIVVKYAMETLGKKKFAIFYQNDDYGKEGLAAAKEALAKRGAELVAEVAYNTSDTDLSAHALKLKESGAEAVLGWPTVKHTAMLLQEAAKIGYKPAWLFSATVNTETLIELAGDASEGVYSLGWLPNVSDTENPFVKEYHAFMDQYAPDMPRVTFTLYGWAQGRLLAEALRRAGPDLTRESFVAALETMNPWPDVATVVYNPQSHAGVTTAWITQFQGDAIVDLTEPIQAD